MDDTLLAYTFLCLGPNQVATRVDLQALEPAGVQAHAANLLREHASATAVEVWKGEVFVALIDREPA